MSAYSIYTSCPVVISHSFSNISSNNCLNPKYPAIAPVKVAVLPLSKKLNEGAEAIFAELSKYYNCEFDDRGNIGKRYRRQDEIGTPFCVTYDFESAEDGAVTVRDRDTMEQVRIIIRSNFDL